MSSILTNTSAMVALQTLKGINANLSKTQNEISTGKSVGSAKDNAAVFAISKVMEADVAGFKAINDSLSLGQSTLAVAANAAEQVGEALNLIKGKIISANEGNVDRTKLNNEVQSLVGQINSIVGSAQFNGLNLLDGSVDGAGGFSVLSALNRASDGSVGLGQIQFDPTSTNLSASSGTDLINNGGAVVTEGGTSGAANATPDQGLTAAQIATDASKEGFGLSGATTGGANTISLGAFQMLTAAGAAGTGAALAAADVDLAGGAPTDGLIAGDKIRLAVGDTTASYTVNVGDRTSDIATGLRDALVAAGIDQSVYTLDTSATAGALTITNTSEETVNGFYQITRASGGLAGLDTLDVTTAAGAQSALDDVEGFIQATIDAQAQLGTSQARLDIQQDFMSSLIDNFSTGIGSLVDADMEAASARLQALQVQQQLATQALSIANQSPQNILSLFR